MFEAGLEDKTTGISFEPCDVFSTTSGAEVFKKFRVALLAAVNDGRLVGVAVGVGVGVNRYAPAGTAVEVSSLFDPSEFLLPCPLAVGTV